jgi:hypothetical protein
MFFGFVKQTEKQPKQIEFRFVSVRNEKKFDCFEDTLASADVSRGQKITKWKEKDEMVGTRIICLPPHLELAASLLTQEVRNVLGIIFLLKPKSGN